MRTSGKTETDSATSPDALEHTTPKTKHAISDEENSLILHPHSFMTRIPKCYSRTICVVIPFVLRAGKIAIMEERECFPFDTTHIAFDFVKEAVRPLPTSGFPPDIGLASAKWATFELHSNVLARWNICRYYIIFSESAY